MTLLAATAWVSNADMIRACAGVGYLRSEWLTVDPTYGRGAWWRIWRPDDLVEHDLAIDGVDFRQLPESDDHFDAAVYDPPYVSTGGRDSSTIVDRHGARYGMVDVPRTPEETQALIDSGLKEVMRVTRGFILVKCQDYVSSHALWLGTYHTTAAALGMGLEVYDRLEYISGVRAQPSGRRQEHAQRNSSTLLVLRKNRRGYRIGRA